MSEDDGHFRGSNGRYSTFEAEIRRLDQLREADQRAVGAALVAADSKNAAALVSADKAISKSEAAQQKVNETQNEFRGTLRDQAATLMPRAEAESVERELRALIDVLRQDLASRLGARTGAIDMRTFVFGLVGALSAGVVIAATVIGMLQP